MRRNTRKITISPKQVVNFIKQVDFSEECWLWTGYINPAGYGLFCEGQASRYSYTMFVGPIPNGLHIDHLCRRRSCVRPTHLEPVTCSENAKRSYASRKNGAPSGTPKAKQDHAEWRRRRNAPPINGYGFKHPDKFSIERN